MIIKISPSSPFQTSSIFGSCCSQNERIQCCRRRCSWGCTPRPSRGPSWVFRTSPPYDGPFAFFSTPISSWSPGGFSSGRSPSHDAPSSSFYGPPSANGSVWPTTFHANATASKSASSSTQSTTITPSINGQRRRRGPTNSSII